MRKEVLEFFASHDLQITKLIDRRPKELTPFQVEKAAEIIYDKLANQYNPRSGSYYIETWYNPRNLASYVWNEAKLVKYEDYLAEKEKMEGWEAVIKRQSYIIIGLTAVLITALIALFISIYVRY